MEKYTERENIISSIAIGIIGLTLTLVNEFKTLPFIEGHETSIALGTIILIYLNQNRQVTSIKQIEKELKNELDQLKNDLKKYYINQRDHINELKKYISNIDNKTLNLLTKEKAGLITDIDVTQVFNDFIGSEYLAYNAPLQYEMENLDERIQFHIERYKSKNFKIAHYYYPIFATKDRDLKYNWLEGVYSFFRELSDSGNLTDQEKLKLNFYIPAKEYSFSMNSQISYFIGKKLRGEEAIVYIHNSAFMDLDGRRPKAMIVVNDANKIEDLRRHRTDTGRKNMVKIDGIDNFLKVLEQELKNLS